MSSPDHHRRSGGLRRLLRRHRHNPPDHNPLIPFASSSTPTTSNNNNQNKNQNESKNKGFASTSLFRGLGCTSSAQAHPPSSSAAAAAVRSSADWEAKRSVGRRRRKKNKETATVGGGGDVWCVEASVDCVVERAHRERPCIARRVTMQEQISAYMDSPPNLDAHFFGPDLSPPPTRFRRMRGAGYHRSPPGIEDELMMFQTRVLLGGMDFYDRHQDWRLNVDHMSYEELLELGDRIGYVNTGLREEEIVRSLRKVKHSVFNSSPHFSDETERKCSICQEEYEVNEEMGKLECGHGYHVYCIKQWLSQKNACPVCKTSVSKT